MEKRDNMHFQASNKAIQAASEKVQLYAGWIVWRGEDGMKFLIYGLDLNGTGREGYNMPQLLV